jgi:nucleoside-diphosphate-sugar epimerase
VARALVFGLSGQLGCAVRPALRTDGWSLDAVSREPREDEDGVRWLPGALPVVDFPDVAYDAVLSLGPLDAFAAAVARQPLRAARVVAIGSTGIHSKAGSPDPAEADLAHRLAAAETTLTTLLGARGTPLAILRPTLIYGHGLDRSLTPLVAFARRRGWLPLPWHARGLRQPVHVDDLAAAVVACLRAPQPIDAAFDLPGGEALPFAAMLARTLAVHAPGARLVRMPTPLFRLGLAVAGARLGTTVSPAGFVARVDRDQVFDAAPARAALGYAPRAFAP